jgi:hypothetical protein
MQETGGGDLPNVHRFEVQDAAESTPDHVIVPASIRGSGAVTGAAVWYGEGFDSTDHSPMVVDLDLWRLLNLDVDEDVPLPAGPELRSYGWMMMAGLVGIRWNWSSRLRPGN